MTDSLEIAQPSRKPGILKGFRDYLPEQMILRQEIIRRFQAVFELHGFDPLDTPAIEYYEVLVGKAGENEKLMYAFEDHGGRRVGLRYDLTVPLARVVAMHQAELVLPFKRYHIAPVWRADRPQRGRFREFWQCDADIAGVPSMAADAEIIAVLADALAAVGLPSFNILISHRLLLERLAVAAGVPDGQAALVYRSIDKLGKIGPDGVRDELVGAGISGRAANDLLDAIQQTGRPADVLQTLQDRLQDDPKAVAALGELNDLFGFLDAMAIPTGVVSLELSLARGLDYYTGPVFEATVTEPSVGSVAGGGRYEGLIGAFLNRPVPATGVSLGLERIIEVVRELGTLPAGTTVADVFVPIVQGDFAVATALASQLRELGFRTDLSALMNRSLGDQLKYADRKGVRHAVIQGPDELAAGAVSIKDLKSGEQLSVKIGALGPRLGELSSS